MLLIGAGLGAYWLGPVAEIGERFHAALTVVAVLALAGAVTIALRAPRTCAPRDLCGHPIFRAGVLGLAIAGFVLLLLSKIYA